MAALCQICAGRGGRLSEWQKAGEEKEAEAGERFLPSSKTDGFRVLECFFSGKMQGKEIAMIELTEQQRRELTATDTPQILDAETGKTYVLVPTEIYERLKALLEDEPRVTGEMVDRLMEEEDRDDPTLAFYQQQYGRKS